MQNNIEQAVAALQAGGLVAFPTETVYGLGADARNEAAIKKVFQAKGRPTDHPLIVHIATVAELENWAINISNDAFTLARHFWPGPLTLVLEKHPQVSELITGGQNTIAIRIPQHPLTFKLLQQLGSGIVGPSANSYGRLSPTTAQHVAQDLGEKLDYILDGGACTVGIESTIVHCTNGETMVLRQGSISAADIIQVLTKPSLINYPKMATVRVPGSAKSHYAPRKPLFLVPSNELMEAVEYFSNQAQQYSYLCLQAAPLGCSNHHWQHAATDPIIYAKNLYANLHQFDADPTSVGIVVEIPPAQPEWEAILDRLTRASVSTLRSQEFMVAEATL